MLKTKSVSSPINKKEDGLRLLVTRFRGRRMPASRYDVWIPSLGPSERLLRSFQGGKAPWKAFRRKYEAEVLSSGPADAGNRTIKNHGQKFLLRLIKFLARAGNVTLMCHCAEDQQQCHRHVLQKLILSKRI
jgi:uncharacterized protein YeaO (DUF488 family)